MVESKDRKANAHLILKLMCDSVVLRPHLRELLSAKYDSLFLYKHIYKYSALYCTLDCPYLSAALFLFACLSLQLLMYIVVAFI